MKLTRALRLGLRREVVILLPVALFLLALLSIFTLLLYRNAVADLVAERHREARAIVELHEPGLALADRARRVFQLIPSHGH